MENALGAPTQGLGQTVTFTTNVPGVPSLQIPAGAQARGGVSGGQQTRNSTNAFSVATEVQVDPTFQVLMKAGEKALAGQVEKIRQEKFVEGMVRASTGAAILDIAAEQPWYSKIFGEGDVVAGARAYTQQNRAQETVLALSEQMPELRKLDQAGFTAAMQSSVKNSMTGDAVTDAGILQAFGRTSASLGSAYTRERYKYLQESALEAFNLSATSGAKALKTSVDELVANAADPSLIDAEKVKFRSQLEKANGMDPNAYKTAMAQVMVGAAESGNFHAVDALSPLMESLPPQLQAQITRSLEINYRQDHQNPRNDKYQRRIDDLIIESRSIPPTAKPEEIAALKTKLFDEAQKINDEYQRASGNPFPIFDSQLARSANLTFAAAAMENKHRLAREAHELAIEQAKNAGALKGAEERQKNIDLQVLSGNAFVLAEGPDKMSAEEEALMVRRNVGDLLMTPGPLNAEQQRRFTAVAHAANIGVGASELRNRLTNQYNQSIGQLGPTFYATYENYLRFRSIPQIGHDLVGRLYPGEQGRRLEMFYHQYPKSLIGPRSPDDATYLAEAFSTAFIGPAPSPGKLDEASAKKAVVQAFKETSYLTPEMFDGDVDSTEASAKELVNNHLKPLIELGLGSGRTQEEATKFALGSFKHNGGLVLGPYFWLDTQNAGKSLDAIFKQGDTKLVFGTDEAQIARGLRDYMNHVIETKKMDQFGMSANRVFVQPMGGGNLGLRFIGEDGRMIFQPTTYKEIGLFMHDRHAKRTAAPEALQERIRRESTPEGRVSAVPPVPNPDELRARFMARKQQQAK